MGADQSKILEMEAKAPGSRTLENRSSQGCSFCADYFANITDLTDVNSYDPPQAQKTVSDFLLCAETCHICKALCDVIAAAEPDYVATHSAACIALKNEMKSRTDRTRRLILFMGTSERVHHRFLLYTPRRAGSEPINKLLPLMPPIEQSAGSSSLVALGRSWLDSCLQEHTEMCKVVDATKRPRRLIQIASGVPGSYTLRIVSGNSTDSHYVALSHCWGQEQNMRTLTSNLSALEQDVPWSVLPQTFKDAVIVTQLLGYSYLWIDSLCIIQDKIDDWAKEATNMASIYENAIVTISAASAAADTEGFLTPRRLAGEARIGNGSSSIGFMRPDYRHDDDRFANMENEMVDPSSSRAWIFQERVLATRTLYFGRHALQWQCRSARKCECEDKYLSGLPQKFGHIQHYLTKKRDFQMDITHIWGPMIVEEYTRRALTHESDKLPALSGIASRMHGVNKDVYIAGLWKGQLGFDLTWERRPLPTVTSASLPKMYRAPSFSWASINGHVAYRNNSGPTFDLIDVSSTPSTSDPFGQVSDGWLTLQTAFLRCWIFLKTEFPQDSMFALEWTETKPASWNPKPTTPCCRADSHLGLVSLWDGDPRAVLLPQAVGRVNVHDDQHTAEGWFPCDCIELGRTASHIYALLLGPSPRLGHAYERLGFVEFYSMARDTDEWLTYAERWDRADREIFTIV